MKGFGLRACKRAGILMAVLSVSGTYAGAQTSLDGEAWRNHLVDDLQGFWRDPAAAGNPEGNFPRYLCHDGTAPNGNPCGGISLSDATNPETSLVAQSRQVYSYGMAFHMTGDTDYLDLARSGLEVQFTNFYNSETGIFQSYAQPGQEIGTGENTNAQKQAYGLLGPSLMAYLTGDAELWTQVTTIADTIQTKFGAETSGLYKEKLGDSGASKRIVDTLDQLNSYQTLLASHAPLANRDAMRDRAYDTAKALKETFYDPETGLFKTSSDQPDGSADTKASYGHSIKALWFIDQTAQLVGDDALAAFAANAATGVFERAFDPEAGSWTSGTDAEGNASDKVRWWDAAELGQYAAALAIDRPELRAMLDETQQFWLEHFVDDDDARAGIWWEVDVADGTPNTSRPKQSEWKAGFHSHEHAFINYLSAQARADQDATLYFAYDSAPPPTQLLYGFEGTIVEFPREPNGVFSAALTSPIQEVSVSALGYRDSAGISAVPLPPSLWAMLLGGGALIAVRRRRPS